MSKICLNPKGQLTLAHATSQESVHNFFLADEKIYLTNGRTKLNLTGTTVKSQYVDYLHSFHIMKKNFRIIL